MARTEIVKQPLSDDGSVVTLGAADATNGMEFQNDGKQALIINNSGTAGITLTVDFARDRYGRDGSKSVSIAAGEEKFIGPFNNVLYNQGTNGNRVHIDFSSDTSVTVGVISL